MELHDPSHKLLAQQVKSSNWREAGQLVMYKYRQGVEPRATWNEPRWFSERNFKLMVTKFHCGYPDRSVTLQVYYLSIWNSSLFFYASSLLLSGASSKTGVVYLSSRHPILVNLLCLSFVGRY